jgi:hypothetical protein
MPPKSKGKGGNASKGGWQRDGAAKTVSIHEFLASSGVGTPSAATTSAGGVGTEVGALQALVTALANPTSQSLYNRAQGPPRTIKLESAEDERRMVAAYALLTAKEADDERLRITKMVEEGVKARLGSPEKSEKKSGGKKKKAKVAVPEQETCSETEESEVPESPVPKKPSRGSMYRKKKKEELDSLQEQLPALLEFRDTVMRLLGDDKVGGSDDESGGAGSGGLIMRHLRRANRTYQLATPSPREKVTPSATKIGTTGTSKGTKPASRDLKFRDLDQDTSLSDTGSESSSKMKAMLAHFAKPTPGPTPKTIPRKLSPIKLFEATLDSLRGAGSLVNKEMFPEPTERYAKQLTPADITMVKPVVDKLMAMMEKAAKAMKQKRQEADLAAKTMIVDGLGCHIGYRVPRGMKLELYLASIIVWLIRAETDFTRDPFTALLIP